MSRLSRFSARWWWAVLTGWVLVGAMLFLVAPAFSKVAIYDFSEFLSKDADSVRGGTLLEDGWDDGSMDRSLVVVAAKDRAPIGAADEAYARGMVEWLDSPAAPGEIGDVTTHLRDPRLRDTLVAPDGKALIIRATVTAPPSSPEANKAATTVLDHVRAAPRPPDLRAYVTGPVAVLADQTRAIDESVGRTHLLALGLIVLILVWVYRSPVAMLVPLTTIGVSYLVSLALVSLLADAGMSVSAMYQTFSVVVIFGIGTDYCLLLVSRYREELEKSDVVEGEEGEMRQRILFGTVAVLATVLASSAATVAVGFGAQALARFGLYRTLGPAMAIAVVVTGLAALTFAPALLRGLGRHLFWPQRPVEASRPAEVDLGKAA